MSIEDNKGIVKDWLENWTGSPRAYLEENAHDDFEYMPVANPESFPRAALGPQDREAVIAALEQTKDLFPEGFKFGIESITAEDDRVVVETTATAVRKDTGRVVTNRGCGVYEIKDGKVFRLRTYEDTAYVMALWREEVNAITEAMAKGG